MTRAQILERAASVDQLRTWIPKGSTVYTILRHTSRSGMRRVIGLVVFIGGDPLSPIHPNFHGARALGRREDGSNEGIVCDGGGMDMGFDLVYNLGHVLYGDGYALTHRWL